MDSVAPHLLADASVLHPLTSGMHADLSVDLTCGYLGTSVREVGLLLSLPLSHHFAAVATVTYITRYPKHDRLNNPGIYCNLFEILIVHRRIMDDSSIQELVTVADRACEEAAS